MFAESAPAKRVLVIEDDALDFAYVEHCLHLSIPESADVTWASTVEQAREILSGQTFDLVVLDYQLGNRTPGSLVKLLRGELGADPARSVPIMVLSSVHPHLLEPFMQALDRSILLEKTEMTLNAFRNTISALGIPALYALH